MCNGQPFRILIVCTGNVCRSPFVERTLQAELDGNSFQVESAGTHALVGQGMTPSIADLVRAHGADDIGFESRQLTKQVLAQQDLALALTREHRSKILEIAPNLLRRTFTLRQFGRMIRVVTAERHPNIDWSASSHDRWAQLPAAVASVRHKVLGKAPDEEDVVDPYGRDHTTHLQMVSQVKPALEALFEFQAASASAQ